MNHQIHERETSMNHTEVIYNTTETFKEKVSKEFPEELRNKPATRKKSLDDGWHLSDLYPEGWFSTDGGPSTINATLAYIDNDYFKWVYGEKKWRDGPGNKSDGTRRRVKSYHNYDVLLSRVCPQLFGVWRDRNQIIQIHLERTKATGVLHERQLQLSELSAYLYNETNKVWQAFEGQGNRLARQVFNPYSWHKDGAPDYLKEYINLSWEDVMFHLPQRPESEVGVGAFFPIQNKYNTWQPTKGDIEIIDIRNGTVLDTLIDSLAETEGTQLTEEEFHGLCEVHQFKVDKPEGRLSSLNRKLMEHGLTITKRRVMKDGVRKNTYQVVSRKVKITFEPIDKAPVRKHLGLISYQ